ncbi:MAG TPA: hypothetical protein VKY22_30120 [Bradyrhizobium sp.]|nr:hypothetical protein [Bradyrhizobium sp.]
MPDIGVSPTVVPYGADQTIYLVVDCVAAAGVCRETEIERPDLDAVIADLLAGKFSAPIRIIAFNTLEHWSRDLSKEVAAEIRMLCDIEGMSVPEHISDFVERYAERARQLVF